jgi:hypothetical protein
VKTLRCLLVAAGLLLLAGAARAQTYGCRASVNCYGPRGFSTQSGASMGSYPAFTMGVSYSNASGLRARWNPPGFGLPEKPDKDAIDGAVGIFLERNPGLKAEKKTATPAKSPASVAPDQDAKKEPEGKPGR